MLSTGRTKFTIFTIRHGQTVPRLEVRRTPTDLYINTLDSNDRQHFSFHESGTSGHKYRLTRQNPEMRVTKHRPPLSDFRGAETVVTLYSILENQPSRKDRKPQKGDMVFDIESPFGLEVILSDRKLDLPARPDRVTKDVQFRDDLFPMVVVEAYPLLNNTLCSPRFDQYNPVTFAPL
jgi:hypothetical protein